MLQIRVKPSGEVLHEDVVELKNWMARFLDTKMVETLLMHMDLDVEEFPRGSKSSLMQNIVSRMQRYSDLPRMINKMNEMSTDEWVDFEFPKVEIVQYVEQPKPTPRPVMIKEPPTPKVPTDERVWSGDKRTLYSKMFNWLGGSNLRTICFDMGIEYGLLGTTKKDLVIQGIIELCIDQSRMTELVKTCENINPYRNWWD